MIYIKQGDRRPAAVVTITRGGAAVDVSTSASVIFRMWHPQESFNTIEAIAHFVTDGTDGKVEYRWAEGDTDTPAQYFATWTVTWPDGTPETFPTLGYDVVLIDGGAPT